MKKTQGIALAALTLLCSFLLQPKAHAEVAPAGTYSPEAVLLARLCVNEATWNLIDCATIAHIRVRSARGRGEDLIAHLHRLHGDHATNRDGTPRLCAALRTDRLTRQGCPRDRRPWIADLRAPGGDGDPTGLNAPARWPEAQMHWADYREAWTRVLDVAQGVINGTVPDPSSVDSDKRPCMWGGPRVDHNRIVRLLARGYVQVHVRGSSNHYFARGEVPVEVAPQL